MTLSLQESVHFEPAATVRLKRILIKEVSKLKLITLAKTKERSIVKSYIAR